MALLPNINIGSSPNDGTGSSLRDAFTIVNENFQLIEAFFPNSEVSNLTANITSTGTSTFNTLNGATIGNVGATIIGATLSAATIGNSGATLTGTISTAAQTNITSLGTLTGLIVNGSSSFNGAAVGVTAGLTVAGQTQYSITNIGSNSYTILTTDNTIVANLEYLGNTTAYLPNADSNSNRTLRFLVYDPTGADDLRLTLEVLPGAGNIFVSANANFSSTFLGATSNQNLQLISNGEYWIPY